jgi:hypothetical protein
MSESTIGADPRQLNSAEAETNPETPNCSRRRFVRGLVTAPVAAAVVAETAQAVPSIEHLPADIEDEDIRVFLNTFTVRPSEDQSWGRDAGCHIDFSGGIFNIMADCRNRMERADVMTSVDSDFDGDLAFFRALHRELYRKGAPIESILPRIRNLPWVSVLIVDGELEFDRRPEQPLETPEPNPLDKNGLLPEASKGYVDIDSEDFEFNGDNRDFVWVDFAKEENPLPLISRLKAQGRHISSIDIAGLTDAEAESLVDRLGKEGFFVGKRNGGMLLESKGLLV